MDIPDSSISAESAYIDKKREELKIFFKDAKFPQEVIDKVIENELKPLKSQENRPYIVASASGEVKSEYEVMTGQPFTQIEDTNRPLTVEEIKEKLKGNPIIAEKARQIQIVTGTEERKPISIPLDKINIAAFSDMRSEIDSADGDIEKVNRLNYKHMQALVNSINDYEAEPVKNTEEDIKLENKSEDNDDEDFEAIEKVVSHYTGKSYETRFQETKDMLLKLADEYEDTQSTTTTKPFINKSHIKSDPILKESSTQLIKGQIRKSVFDEVKETYAINEVMNMSLKDNPVTPDLNRKEISKIEIKQKENKEEIIDSEVSYYEVFPKSMETKLKETEEALLAINSVLNSTAESNNQTSNLTERILTVNNDTLQVDKNDITENNLAAAKKQKFDEKIELTLQTALEDIFEMSNNENKDNNEMEFKEMKSLARNIVEGADNLSTLIREDITNKLNSMNELLNDVNEALENSRKSNIAYQKLKEERENWQKETSIKVDRAETEENSNKTDFEEVVPKGTVTENSINDIHDAINKLNAEIKCHEERINKSKESYEQRNEECKVFIEEVDEILKKSHGILHPAKQATDKLENMDMENITKVHKQKDETQQSERFKSESYDVKSNYDDETNKNLSEFKQRELDRNKRINALLYDIKDKMKDNKEVLRLANSMLHREENRKKTLLGAAGCRKIQEQESSVVDKQAQGDHIRNIGNEELTPQAMLTEVTQEDEMKKQQKQKEKEEAKKRERLKLEKELEEMNRGPRMTKEFIRNHCKQHKLYCTPQLNDILYLHFKGFSTIENLEEYTGLKCLFLENNGIQRIEGLDTLSQLKCLYLHYNVVRKIENLDGCPKLDTLNLDHNFVTKIENLDVVPDLHTLSIAHNMLTSVEDLAHLKMCRNLSVLDLSYNRLEDPLIVDVLADMILLKVLVLTGNPVVRNIPAYRKTLTLRLKELLNLDNRPVFPRDRACAEAWQRGGVQEEIAERKRWIAKEQEKTMQSVRYLIKMRDEKRALREAREKEEREKLGLPPKDEDELGEDIKKDALENVCSIKEFEGPSPMEEKFGPAEVKIKNGVAVDMLTGSEADDSSSEDSTSEESSDEGIDDAKQNKVTEPSTSKIEWSQLEVGKRLVQEINDKPQEVTQPDDYWYGYSGDFKPKQESSKFLSDIKSINNLLFNQPPHTEKKKITEVLEVSKKQEHQNDKTEKEDTVGEEAKKKPLIEIVDENIIIEENKSYAEENSAVSSGITEEGNMVIDHDRKLIIDKNKDKKTKKRRLHVSESDKTQTSKNHLKKIEIKEIRSPESLTRTVVTITPSDSDNQPKKETEENKPQKEESANNEGSSESKIDTNSEAKKLSVKQGTGDGVALINYMHRINSGEDGDDEDLEPSAEDLEIFAELEREQEERQARIDRGEPPVDPMKLYHKSTMEEFYKAEERLAAHEVKDRSRYTTYRHDNAFDRVAFSQLTAGDKPDEDKVKLTYVPGAVLFEYVENQKPTADVEYQIGEEVIDSGPSSADTESINISSDATSSSEDDTDINSKRVKKTNRPTSAVPKNTNNKQDTANKSTIANKHRDSSGRDSGNNRLKDEDKKGNGSKRSQKPVKTTGKKNVNNSSSNIGKGNEACKNSNETDITNRKDSNTSTKSEDSSKKIQKRYEVKSKKRNYELMKLEEDGEIPQWPKCSITSSDNPLPSTSYPIEMPSYENMLNLDREEAKRSIIDTINSYEDERFPSQGVDYSDIRSNARIEQSVASEILDRTLEYEEREYYRQRDAITSQAGNIDNKTNAIIEQLSDSLHNEYSLPEVSRILEAHMQTAEQLWRAGDLTRYRSVSPTESVDERDDADTLVPSRDISFEDTLTEETAVNSATATAIDDSGIGVSVNGDENDRNTSSNDINATNEIGGNLFDDNRDKYNNSNKETENNSTEDSNKTSENDFKEINEENVSINKEIEYHSFDDNNDSKLDDFESVLDDCELANEVFEDCEDLSEKANDVSGVNESNVSNADIGFGRLNENLSLEMKLALESDRNI
ncbi:unnamed protein product [Chilo suppressalis]|uniref:Dynein axonemal assembly factor 1 homolog n=1 Tax=Chilo suppressalis TaxID=168631 RepID=A0ABN8B0V9_CHISP|nr:unnamed protein product [Chilo suppressalis]